jgi:NTE family protein
VERRTIDLFQGSHRLARYDVSAGYANLDFGADLGRYGEARVGMQTGAGHISLDTGPPEFNPPNSHVRIGGFTGRFIVDQLDSADFPRAGYAGSLHILDNTRALGGQDAFTRWDADAFVVGSAGRHTLAGGLKFGGNLHGGDLPPYALFQWGGLLQQSGYPTGALVGQRLQFGRLVYYYKLVDTRIFEGMYVGGSLEAGRMDEPLVPGSPTGLLKSAAVFMGLDTPVGPLYLGYGRAADGNSAAYLFLGRP